MKDAIRRWSCLVLAFAALGVVRSAETPAPEDPVREDPARTGRSATAVVEALTRAFNAHDVSAMLEHVADDVEWLAVQGAAVAVEARGKAALREGMTGYFRALPSARSAVEAMLASGPWITARECASWTASDGDVRSQSAVAVYEIRDGLVARVWYFPAEPGCSGHEKR